MTDVETKVILLGQKSQLSSVSSDERFSDPQSLTVQKQVFFNKATYSFEYVFAPNPSKNLFDELRKSGADLFSFVARSFINKKHFPFDSRAANIGLLEISSYDEWWNKVARKQIRNRVRQAVKQGIEVKLVQANEEINKSIVRIYNETPFRQGRSFIGYGVDLATVSKWYTNQSNNQLLVAYYNNEVVGFLGLVVGDNVARLNRFLSSMKYREKGVSNLLMAEAVKLCDKKGIKFFVYGNMGNLPNLDHFKEQNGFKQYSDTRYFVPLTSKGALAIKLNAHEAFVYVLPRKVQRALLPIYSQATRVIPISILKKTGLTF